MEAEKKLISVIMPVYNAEKTLNASAESILTQSYGRIELIMVNDGSKDGSLEICQRIAEKDPRVRVLTQRNAGPAAARNAALDVAAGEWIMFSDSDDFFAPGAFQIMADAMADNDLTSAHYFLDVGKISSPRGLLSGCRVLEESEFLMELMQKPGAFYFSALWNKMYRADLIRARGIRFDPFLEWGEDFGFNMRYYHDVQKVALTDVPVYHYVKSPVSTSVRTLLNVSRSCRIKARLYRELKGLYVEKGLYDQHKHLIDRYLLNVTLAD